MMSQITIRNLPPEVEQRLRLEARRSGTSLNKTVIRLLNEATGVEPRCGPKRDLSSVAGQWDDQQVDEFQRATEIFGQVDEELWR